MFITLFSDKEHAANWGLREPWRCNQQKAEDWSLYTIETFGAPESCIFFRLSHLTRGLNLDLPKGVKQHIKKAFLCLRQIPREAVAQKMDPQKARLCTARLLQFL